MATDRDSAFLKKQDKIVDEYEQQKENFEWLRLPYWKRYDLDHINGIDDGEPPGWYYREHREEFDLKEEV